MTREELEAEAREFCMWTLGPVAVKSKALADFAERIQREAVEDERKALREIVRFEVRLMPEERAAILAALDARSNEERMEDRQAGIDQGQQ